MLTGADISHWDPVIDWPAVKSSGLVNFLFFKATQADRIIDKTFFDNCEHSSEFEIPWSAYHFYDYRLRAGVQSSFFIDVIGRDKKKLRYMLPPVIDLEPVSDYSTGERVIVPYPPRDKLITSLHSLFLSLYRVYSRFPILYTNYSTIKYLKPIPNWMRYFRLWIAAYTLAKSPFYAPWPKWTFWQYSESGSIPGIDGAVDLDRFNGDISLLKSMIIH